MGKNEEKMIMKNVAIIIYSLENGGGAEKNAAFLSEYLAKFFNLYVFVDKDCESTYECKGTIVKINEAVNGKEIICSKALKTLKKKYKIDISISFGDSLNIANILSKGNERVIISERTSYSRHIPKRNVVEKEIQKYYKYADAIVACSYGVKKDIGDIAKIQAKDIKVIYNFVDDVRLHSLATKPVNKKIEIFLQGAPYFVNVGRFVDTKRQDILIDEFVEFHHVNANHKLILIGYGKRKDYLEKIIKETGLEDSIGIFSDIDNVYSIIKNADALILSSYREGLPNVLLEAMALETPIISSDCFSGPRELLNNEHDYDVNYEYPMICKRGILFNENGFGLKEAMVQIIKDKALKKTMVFEQKKYMQKYKNDEIWNLWNEVLLEENQKITCASNGEDILNKYEHIYIYGAGKVGYRTYYTYSEKCKIEGFIVTDKSKQDDRRMISCISIFTLDEVAVAENSTLVIIGVGEEYIDEVYRAVTSAGCKNLFIPW